MAQTGLPGVGQAALTDIDTLIAISKTGQVKRLPVSAVGGGGGGSAAAAHTDTRNPTNADDTADGYTAGQFWINTTTGRAFYARSVAAGAAAWEPIGVSDHPGYLPGAAYAPKGMKILGTNPGQIVPTTPGRILFSKGGFEERVSLANILIKASSAVANSLAQVAGYKISPTTKRPTGDPLFKTGDIDISAVGVKVAALAAAYTAEPGSIAWGLMVNQASGSALTALDGGDGTAQQGWGYSNTDIFGLVTGVYYAGTYGVWPTFTDTSVFATSYGLHPAISFVAGAPS